MIILLVDDDAALRAGMTMALRDDGHEVHAVASTGGALKLLDQADVLITDVNLPESPQAGIDLTREALRRSPGLPIIVITGNASIAQAVQALRLGARTYLQKPFPTADLLRELSEIQELTGLRQGVSGRCGLIGSSAGMRRAYAQIDIAASCDFPVLIGGETGTGKELAARAIHSLSRRQGKPFIAVNCAAIPRELAESELFGHEAGAFTGALAARQGRFALARHGTLFLDEINSLPLELQPKILRALDSGEIWPVGGSHPVETDARFIAATNLDLPRAVAEGRFRADLYYRLNVLSVTMPALRERMEDIPAIASALLERDTPTHPSAALTADALASLLGHIWPGNVRELANVVQRARVVAQAQAQADAPVVIAAEHLLLPSWLPSVPFKQAQEDAIDEWSRRTVRAALALCDGNAAAAAESLQMDRSALYRLAKRLGITLTHI